jgi:hypothetical protein
MKESVAKLTRCLPLMGTAGALRLLLHEQWRQIMADKFDRLSDGSPRDASLMGSNSHVPLYVGLLLAAVIVGLALSLAGVL